MGATNLRLLGDFKSIVNLDAEIPFLGDGYARTPPPDLLFLQRKFAGTFMLCARLRARVDLGQVFAGEL